MDDRVVMGVCVLEFVLTVPLLFPPLRRRLLLLLLLLLEGLRTAAAAAAALLLRRDPDPLLHGFRAGDP